MDAGHRTRRGESGRLQRAAGLARSRSSRAPWVPRGAPFARKILASHPWDEDTAPKTARAAARNQSLILGDHPRRVVHEILGLHSPDSPGQPRHGRRPPHQAAKVAGCNEPPTLDDHARLMLHEILGPPFARGT
jgi:hypothetical protein